MGQHGLTLGHRRQSGDNQDNSTEDRQALRLNGNPRPKCLRTIGCKCKYRGDCKRQSADEATTRGVMSLQQQGQRQ